MLLVEFHHYCCSEGVDSCSDGGVGLFAQAVEALGSGGRDGDVCWVGILDGEFGVVQERCEFGW